MSCSVCVSSPFILPYSVKESLSMFSLPVSRKGTRQSFRRGQSAPRSNPLPFYIPFFTEKHPLLPICDLNIITTGKQTQQQQQKQNNNNNNNNNKRKD